MNPASQWTTLEVCKWMQEKGHEQYVTMFAENHVNGDVLLTLVSDDLLQMGMSSIGHRKAFLKSLHGTPTARTGRHSYGAYYHAWVWHVSELKAEAAPRIRKIAIEGNIAAGKSTFLNILARELDFFVVPEPVSRWTNMKSEEDDPNAVSTSQQTGGNLLDMFYVRCRVTLVPLRLRSRALWSRVPEASS